MITKIGITSGDIWNHLEKKNGSAKLGDMVSALREDRDLALMGIGWLAREGHIVLEGRSPNYTIRLVEQS